MDLNAMPRPHAEAARAGSPIRIDARLDEAAWAAAPVIDRFIQQIPVPGAPASERTEVRILYDDDNLYVGAEMFDSDPSGIINTTLQRDPSTAQGDALGFTFDTFRDGTNGYVFFVNPGGAVRDLQNSDDGRVRNLAWDTSWEVETRVHEGGWTVEMSIPWSALRFEGGKQEQVWGMHLFRRIRRKNEEVVWAPMDRRWSIYNVSRAGTLGGLDGIQSGRNLSVKPYLLANRPSGSLQSDAGSEAKAGADLKYGITSSLTLDVTLNTEFAQVEADRQQVNLTRFSLFFPERREFFLENAGLFKFGDQAETGVRSGSSDRDFTLFHSRRIGLTPAGAPLPILGGGRVSGTAGPLSLGLLNMQTRREGNVVPENFTVARVRGALGGDLTAGAIVVNRSTTSGPRADNRSYGIDAEYSVLNEYLRVQSYLALTEGTLADGTRLDPSFAGRASVSWRDPLWEVSAMYRQLGGDFRPGVGFVQRRGVRHVYGTIGLRPRVSWPGVLEVNPYVLTHYFEALTGGLETRELVGGLGMDFRDGSTGSIEFKDSFERVHAPFSVGGTTVPAGDYAFQDGSVSYTSSGARELLGRLSLGGGGYYGGNRFSVGGSLLARFGSRVILDLTAEQNRIDLPGQPLANAAVYGARVDGFFSTRLITTALLQYDDASNELVSDLRLNWVHAPLSDLYLVVTERRDTKGGAVLERLFTLKVTRFFAF